MTKERLGFICLLIFAAAAARLLPHWPNFTPVAAIALFGGAYLTPRWLAFIIPLVAMLVSDAIIGFYPQVYVTYLAFIAVTLLGLTLRTRRSALKLLGVTLSASVTFFAITNFALWIHYDLYPKTIEGVVQGYIAALPFFQNTLLGDMFYTGVLFGALALAERRLPVLRAPVMARTA